LDGYGLRFCRARSERRGKKHDHTEGRASHQCNCSPVVASDVADREEPEEELNAFAEPSGNITVNVVPLPRADSTLIVPLCSSSIVPSTNNNPMPDPFCLVVK